MSAADTTTGRGGGLRRQLRRMWTVCVVTPLLVMATAASARAGGDASGPPAALSWMQMNDSHGISIWNYDLSFDRGGPTDPGKAMWSFITDIGWQVYRAAIGFVLWLIDWTLSFGWMGWVQAPLATVSASFSDVLDRVGLQPLLLTVVMAVGAMLLMRGAVAAGLYEMLMGSAVAALAIGMLANPLSVVGGNDGFIMKARDLGLETGGAIRADNETAGDPEQVRAAVSEDMADIFVRTSHQLINFNTVIDGTSCEGAYDTALDWEVKSVDGPQYAVLSDSVVVDGDGKKIGYGSAPDNDHLREEMGDCSRALGDAAGNPSWSHAINMVALGFGATVLVLFAFLLCGVVLTSSFYAMWLAVKALWNLLTGILPFGNQRIALAKTFTDLIMALAVVVFSMIFLVAYMQFVTAVFASDAGTTTTTGPFGGVAQTTAANPMQRFIILDVALIGGIFVFWRTRKRMKASSGSLAQKLAKRPKTAPRPLPTPGPTAGAMLSQARQQARVARTTVGAGARKSVTGAKIVKKGASAAGKVAATGTMYGVAAGYLAGKGAGHVARHTVTRARPQDSTAAAAVVQPRQSGPAVAGVRHRAEPTMPSPQSKGPLTRPALPAGGGVGILTGPEHPSPSQLGPSRTPRQIAAVAGRRRLLERLGSTAPSSSPKPQPGPVAAESSQGPRPVASAPTPSSAAAPRRLLPGTASSSPSSSPKPQPGTGKPPAPATPRPAAVKSSSAAPQPRPVAAKSSSAASQPRPAAAKPSPPSSQPRPVAARSAPPSSPEPSRPIPTVRAHRSYDRVVKDGQVVLVPRRDRSPTP